jgi:lambda repressor-like predicted transcriptional regulator
MSNELQNSQNKTNISPTKEIKDSNPKMHQVTFQDLIIFKEDILKELRNFKTKMSNNINNEFDKYSNLLQKANTNLSIYEKDKIAYMTKVDFAEEKEKLIFELSNKDSELKNQVMINQLHISSCRKDIDDSCFKYDKIIADNLMVPGLVGKSCKFQNIKEYILYNKEEINNALFANRQTGIDVNILKRKIDTTSGQLNTKMKSTEYRLSNFITSKFNEINQKYERLYDELNKRMNTLTHELNANLEERNNEIARLKNFVFEENGKAIEGVNAIKADIKKEFKAMNKDNKSVRKNLVNLTNLLMGRNYAQNRQYIVNNFNSMMFEAFKEMGLVSNVSMKNESPSLEKKSSKHQATSFVKKYIEGKITSDEAKYESGGIKNKKSLKIIKRKC